MGSGKSKANLGNSILQAFAKFLDFTSDFTSSYDDAVLLKASLHDISEIEAMHISYESNNNGLTPLHMAIAREIGWENIFIFCPYFGYLIPYRKLNRICNIEYYFTKSSCTFNFFSDSLPFKFHVF